MSDGPKTASELYDLLKPFQEKKGYYFNPDSNLTTPLLEELLVTRKRYGYMACPCRLANGQYEKDKDIICPCVYRADDVAEFGACFCGLYVSEKKSREPAGTEIIVPERRPPERICL